MPPILRVTGALGGGGPGPGTTDEVVVPRTYFGVVAVRDIVYQNGAGQAVRANASSYATGRVIGFIRAVDLPIVGQVEVMLQGDLGGFVGLTPGATYIAATTPGGIVREDDTGNVNYPNGPGEVIQVVGVALTATTLLVDLSQSLVVL